MKQRVFLFSLILVFAFEIVLSQDKAADLQIQKIESYKKFKIVRSDKNSLAAMNNPADTTIRVLELVNYTNKKSGFGKVIQRSRYQGTEVKRVCYFTSTEKLFAIKDSILYDNHTTRQLTYYLVKGKLQYAIDSKNQDVTANINQAELSDWLNSMFSEEDIK